MHELLLGTTYLFSRQRREKMSWQIRITTKSFWLRKGKIFIIVTYFVYGR